MNAIGLLFTVVTAYLLFTLPRRMAHLPLLAGGLYMTNGQVLEIGPAHFTVVRLLVIIGFVRAMSKREHASGGLVILDRLMLGWAACLVASSFFHDPFSNSLVYRLGLAYEYLGFYWLMRIFLQDYDDVLLASKTVLILMVPLALEMLFEKATDRNMFGALGGAPDYSEIRNGRIRAQGPFGHSILAGTAGAVCLPLALLFWQRNRKVALLGLAATGAIVLASASSGPLMTLGFSLFAMALWKFRSHLRLIVWAGVGMIVALDLVMNDPVYFILARIDLAGGSTGYYRAALIDAAIRHFGEWWFFGTDYTRHWMPTGIAANANHCDLVNHYIAMGVMGGLPLMLLFMWIIFGSFTLLGKIMDSAGESDASFMAWTFGAILFGHATAFTSVSYFDQTNLLLYFLLAGIGTVFATLPEKVPTPSEEATEATEAELDPDAKTENAESATPN